MKLRALVLWCVPLVFLIVYSLQRGYYFAIDITAVVAVRFLLALTIAAIVLSPMLLVKKTPVTGSRLARTELFAIVVSAIVIVHILLTHYTE